KFLRFESFTLDLDRLSLVGPLGQMELRRKSFELRRYLIEHAGRALTKEEIIDSVWPDVTVSDESVTQCISEVRHALGEQSRRIIKTVPRRGYLLDVRISRTDLIATKTPNDKNQSVQSLFPALPLSDRAS